MTSTAGIQGLIKALGSVPDETVIDGEIVELNGDDRPSFNARCEAPRQ
jgi:hypothetical protein